MIRAWTGGPEALRRRGRRLAPVLGLTPGLLSGCAGTARPALHRNAIDAAVAAGVRHVVCTSFADLDDNDSPLANE